MQENFRTQAFGFNKKDVIDYIYELSTEKETIAKESGERIEKLTAENENLSAQNAEYSKEIERFEKLVGELRAELADANIQKSRLFEENNENRRMLLDNEREFNIKNEQINKLIAENEAYAEKCAKYAEISENVGKTIMEAKKMASDIIKKAEDEALEIRAVTNKTAEEILGEISLAKDEVENLKANLSDAIRICENRIKTVELNLGSVEESVNGFKTDASSEETEEKASFTIPEAKDFF